MARHDRRARPYRGGKRPARATPTDLNVNLSSADLVPAELQPALRLAAGRRDVIGDIDLSTIDLRQYHYDPDQPRDRMGRWTDTAISNAWIQGGHAFREIRDDSNPEMSGAFADMLSRQPFAEGDLYRGTSHPDFETLKVGDVLDWKTPKSSTTALATAARFGTKGRHAPTLYRVKTSVAKILPGQDRFVTMHEAIIPPGRFQVTGVSTVPLDASGPRMIALHPDAPQMATVVDLQDVTEGPRPFFLGRGGRHKRRKVKGNRGMLDLAFDPHQPRDPHTGEWTDTHVLHPSQASLLKQFGTPTRAATPNVETEPEHGFIPDDDNGMPGVGPGEQDSVKQQEMAQRHAERWQEDAFTRMGGEEVAGNEDSEGGAAVAWCTYQMPMYYSQMNNVLRSGKGKADIAFGNDDVLFTADYTLTQSLVKQFFQKGGTTTTKPMTVYRALRTTGKPNAKGRINWAETLKPGTTFEEKGISSSTAFKRLAQGWLGLSGSASAREDTKTLPIDDVVLEVHVPVGSRIVGGTSGFIETMLPPGTKYKITGWKRVRTPNAVNPLTSMPLGEPITYTHVTAEAILPDGYSKPVKAPKADREAKLATARAALTKARRPAIAKSPYDVDGYHLGDSGD